MLIPFAQLFALLGTLQRIGDYLDFLRHALQRGIARNAYDLNAAFFQLFEHQRRFGQFGRQHQRRFQRQNTFGIKLTHVADIRQLFDGFRLQTGTVARNHFIARAECEGNFGDVTAYRDNTFRRRSGEG
ncbi:hypothetical protein D3C76_1535650 [compost metagenome]